MWARAIVRPAAVSGRDGMLIGAINQLVSLLNPFPTLTSRFIFSTLFSFSEIISSVLARKKKGT